VIGQSVNTRKISGIFRLLTFNKAKGLPQKSLDLNLLSVIVHLRPN
jgi:hypothetical protein